jgi:outer membrane protein OmpA-like peptidoglycan-associated protein
MGYEQHWDNQQLKTSTGRLVEISKEGETMRCNHITTTVTLGSVLCLVSLAGIVFGQAAGPMTDFRGRSDYTVEELRQALTSSAAPAVTHRGIGPASKPAELPPVHNGATAVLNVLFASNSDRILPAYYADLAKLGQALTPILASGANLRIEGHTDSLGPDPYNERLSQKRAESVKRYLVEQFALPPERMLAEGYGESRPIETNDTPAGRSQNRRVQVVNLGTK